MYNYNSDNGKWTRRNDTLSKESFDAIKQDFESVKMFSKCLSGSTYTNMNYFNDIYDKLKYTNDKSYYITNSFSEYAKPYSIQNGIQVDDNFYTEYLKNYGNTLKNTFSPNDLLNNYDNIHTVQYSTVSFDAYDEALYDNFIIDKQLNTDVDFNGTYYEVYIDGYKLVKGDRVLFRTQLDSLSLMMTEDPLVYLNNTEFYSQIVEIDENDQTVITNYIRYCNETNGIYEYDGKSFNRVEVDLNDLYIYVENGLVNSNKTFTLFNNNNGYNPSSGDIVFSFKEVDRYAIRHKVDYNNAYDINFLDLLYQPEHVVTINGNDHIVQERTITVGEFGNIIINQNNISISINNREKVNLNGITSTNGYYWICGDDSTVLKINKVTLDIEYLKIDGFKNFKSIDFIDDLNGVVVGDLNSIYVTLDGGKIWEDISLTEYNNINLNKVMFVNFSEIYISSTNGYFFHVTSNYNKWTYNKKYISKVINDELSIILETTITDFIKIDNDIIIISNDNDFIKYDINNDKFNYYDFKFNFNEFNTLTHYVDNKVLLSDGDAVYLIDLNDFTQEEEWSNILSGEQYISTIIYVGYINKMTYHNKLYICGNNSLFGKIDDMLVPTFVEMDPGFNDRISSKMLFLDYDIASKLNFFTDEGIYRLPNSISHSGNINSLLFNNADTNWMDFYSDSLGIFEYYANENNKKVELNKSFRKTNSDILLTNPRIGKDKDYCKSYFPTIVDNTKNIYFNSGELSPIVTLNDNIDLILFNNLMVIRTPNDMDIKLGDVIKISSNVVTTNLIVNKIIENNSRKYIYLYSNFNDNIINNLYKNSLSYNLSNGLTIRNLNTFSSIDNLVENFNNHIFGLSYNMEYDNGKLDINALFSNVSSYYNLDTNVYINDNSLYRMDYNESYAKFGFETKYNIKSYLQNISDVFTNNMEFNILPKYYNIPCDSSGMGIRLEQVASNKLILGSGMSREYESLLYNTFVDIQYNDNYKEERFLIVDKKIDDETGEFIIYLDRKLSYVTGVNQINILSRNTLEQISDDLMLLNNIFRPKFNKNIIGGHKYDTFEKQLKRRFYTDSYAKALLSNQMIKEHLTGIIYIDNNYSLSMNVVNIETSDSFDIISIGKHSNQNKYIINMSFNHNLKPNDYIIIDATNKNDKRASGLHIVDSINSNTSVVLKTTFVPTPGVITNHGKGLFVDRDIFFSYLPVDISKISKSNTLGIPIELYINNYVLGENGFKLLGVDLNNYRYTLVDNMLNSKIHDKYHWILEAEISKAIIGEDSDGLVWYSGNWRCGRWFDGKWYSGNWISGDWYSGDWYSRKNTYKLTNVDVSDYDTNEHSFWYNGRWYDGSFNGGVWYNGRWYDGSFNDGSFNNGIWNEGTFNNGKFSGGIWVSGTWYGGIFNMDINKSYWIDGTWYGGDFENGRWMNGTFNQLPNSISRFGTKSTSSKQSIWDTGVFNGGEVHSYLTLLGDKPTSSEIYRNTIIKTCTWNSGSFYGGIAFNVNFKSGDFYGGIIDDIQIKAIHIRKAVYDNTYGAIEIKLDLNGVFHFKDNNEIYLLNNVYESTPVNGNEYDLRLLGNYDNRKSYRVLEYNVINNEYTEVILRTDLIQSDFDNIDSSDTSETGYLKSFYDVRLYSLGDKNISTTLVSRFRNSNIHNCTWYNGIFEDGYFIGGTWHNGYFNGNWGK